MNRTIWLKECQGFGWDDRLGSGFQAGCEVCMNCKGGQPIRYAACEAEAKAGREKSKKKENIVNENENVGQADDEVDVTETDVVSAQQQTKKPKAGKKVEKAVDISPLGIARTKFNVRPGSKPCVTFDLIYEGGTKTEIVKKMAAMGTFWKTEKAAMSWLDHIISHWTQKRSYVGIRVDGDVIKYVV